MSNVFLSYAVEDRALARTVHGWLIDDGHEVFEYLDPRDGTALGEQWEQRLYERLRWADAMVCVVTSAYVKSAWCTAEAGIARSRGTRLLPIFAEPGVSHPVLASTHYADYAQDPDAARATVIEALRRVRGPWWSRSRRPEWLRRALRPGRRAIAGLIAGAVSVGLAAAWLIPVPDTVDAATQRERNADPCPLLDTAALERSGDEVTLMTPRYLDTCLATIASPGHETIARVAFEPASPLPSLISDAEPDQIEPLGGLHIKWGKEDLLSDRRECTHRLWVDEDKPVIAFETRIYDKNQIDICRVGRAAVMPAITELVRNGITYKNNRTGNFTHAQSDACSLLDATALGKVPGLDPNSAEPDYGKWRCTWSGNDGRTEVTLELMLEKPGFTGYVNGVHIDVDEKRTRVSGDSTGCSADVLHRPSPGPGQATEMLRLRVEAPGFAQEQLCALVTDLAVAAEKRLQINGCRNGGVLKYVLCWLTLRS